MILKKCYLLSFLAFFPLFCSEVLTFDNLYPSSTYEKAYKVAAESYYDIDFFSVCEQTNNQRKLFLINFWSSVLNLYGYVQKIISENKYASFLQDYLYLKDLIEEVQKKFSNLGIQDDYSISINLVFKTTISNIINSLHAKKGFKNCH